MLWGEDPVKVENSFCVFSGKIILPGGRGTL